MNYHFLIYSIMLLKPYVLVCPQLILAPCQYASRSVAFIKLVVYTALGCFISNKLCVYRITPITLEFVSLGHFGVSFSAVVNLMRFHLIYLILSILFVIIDCLIFVRESNC